MLALWLLICALWLAAAANDVRRVRNGRRLWTANQYLRSVLDNVDPLWTWIWLTALTVVGVAGVVEVLVVRI